MKKLLISFVLVLFIIGNLTAEDSEADNSGADEEYLPPSFGLIFNTDNILLEPDLYMGGIGFKLSYPEHAFRFSVGVNYETSANENIDSKVSFVFEKPFFKERVSPYTGLVTLLELSHESLVTDDENWTKTLSLSGGIGGILGCEVFITDFLSVFAEYKLALNIAWSRVSQTAGGDILEPVDAVNYLFGTGVGNMGSLGCVIYTNPKQSSQ